jgi:hypothetical protein
MFNGPKGLSMAFNTIQPIPLDRETRAALPTAEAAVHLNRAEQTMRVWACKENGPIRPIRVNGRLAWKTADIRSLLGIGGAADSGNK